MDLYLVLNLVLVIVGIWLVNRFVRWLREPKEDARAESLRLNINDALQNGLVRKEPVNSRCGTGR